MSILLAISEIQEFLEKDRNERYFICDNNTANQTFDPKKRQFSAEIQDSDGYTINIDDTTKMIAYGETLSDAIINLARKL